MKITLVTGDEHNSIVNYVAENISNENALYMSFPEYEERMHPREELKIADKIITIAMSLEEPVWVSTFSEAIFLRILYRIRHKTISHKDITVKVLLEGKCHIVQINEKGEFCSPFPGGFFTWRGYELF